MDTIAYQALAALTAALNADRPFDIPLAEPGQWFPGEPLPGPALRVFFHSEDTNPVPGRLPLNRNDLVVAIQAIVSAETSAETDALIEPIRAHIASVVGSTTFDGLLHETQYRGTKWERARLELVYAWATMGWLLRFQTHRADFTRRS